MFEILTFRLAPGVDEAAFRAIDERVQTEFFYQHPEVQQRLAAIEKAVLEGKLTSFRGADELIRLFTSR